MEYQNLIYETRDGVAYLTLNRPERKNALGGSMREDLLDALARADADPQVRVVILTGAGSAFCAGGDVKEMSRAFEQGIERPLKEKIAPVRDRIVLALYEVSKPVIAAVNGAAAGAGMNIALAADIRIASTTALFAQSFVKRGVHPDFGGTYFLPRVVGMAMACELIFTGESIAAEKALSLGIVSRVVPPERLMETASQLAAKIAAGPPIAIQLAKRCLRQSANGGLREALDRETAAQNLCFDTEDAREGMRAFVEKRAPVFRGL